MPFEVTANNYTVTITSKVPSTLTIASSRVLLFTVDTGTQLVSVQSTAVAATLAK